MDDHRKALCERVANTLRRCDATNGNAFVRGLFANGSLPAAGVCDDGPVDYDAFVRWLLDDRRPPEAGCGPQPTAPASPPSSASAAPAKHVETISLEVGGYRFITQLSTMRACPEGSPLRELIRHPPGYLGHYFIDRDGRQFHHVLNFLRDGGDAFTAPTDPLARRELYREACHYGLWNLALLIQSAYPGAPTPFNEPERLKKLESLNIMHTEEREFNYDCLTKMVKALLDMPIVLISLVGDDHQWFKSRCGLAANQTPKNTSFCAFSFLPAHPEVLVVENATTDPRTCNNPLVIGEPYIGFYAGCPLVTSDGFRLGALCVIDHVPRKLMRWQFQALVNFGHIAVQEIQRRELERAKPPVENLTWEDVEKPSSNSGASARRDAWRGFGTSQVVATGMNYGSGLLRQSRMKEALQEIVCLVQVNTNCMSWPVLYANQTWTAYTDLQIRPPEFTISLEKLGCPDMFMNWPSLWDFLALPAGTSEQTFLQQVCDAWEAYAEPHVFGLMANLVTVPASEAKTAGREVIRKVSCRLVPVQDSLDVAAAVVNPRPGVKAIKNTQYPKGKSPECYLYFVLMSFVESDTPSLGQADSQPKLPSPEAIEGGASPPEGAEDRRHSESPKPPDTTLQELPRQESGSSNSIISSTQGPSNSNSQLSGVQLKPTRPPFVDVKLSRKVGQGSFGKVFYGQWLGSPVAVKVVEWKGKGDIIEPLFEAELSCTLSHPNLVQTFKYSTREKPERHESSGRKAKKVEDEPPGGGEALTYQTWIVQEWCDAGTLRTLCDHPRNDAKGHIEVLQICAEIASGGSYLHSRGIIHGDLTANNVLCKTQVSTKGYVCKICDFGLARILEGESTGIMTNQLGTVTHMPPELFDVDAQIELTTKADVYALGVLLWQALCGQSPWAGLAAPTVIIQIAKGKRLHMPADTPASITEIFVKCSADEPDARPCMDELAGQLDDVLRSFQDQEESSVASGDSGNHA